MIEIEVNNDSNAALYFLPLQRRIRGTLDLRKMMDVDAGSLFSKWSEPIPGQRLTFDPESGTAAIIEPLQSNAALKAKIEAHGWRVGQGETFANIDVPTWAFWLNRAVESGLAKLVKGTLPTATGKARKRFLGQEQADPQAKLQKMQLAAQLAVMTPQQRKDYERILAELE